MLKKVDPKELEFNVFSAIGDQWMLITAGDEEQCNTMTASWGGLGILWGSPIAIAYIRPQRYTKEFVDREEYFTLSFFGPEYRPQLALCGSKSGRDVDKVAECGFTVARKRMAQRMNPSYIPEDVREKWYQEGDYHTMYIGEIVEALVKHH